MTLQTLGTAAVNTLNRSLVWTAGVDQADVRVVNSLIQNDQNPRLPVAQIGGSGGFVREGLLYVPNRGVLTLFPGDVVGIASILGKWPILVTAYGISAGPWTLT